MTGTRSGDWRIRPIEASDRALLERMYRDFEPKRAAQGLPPDSPVRIREWLGRVLGRGLHAVAIAGRVIVGHVMLVPFADDTVELANFVHQSWRGRGMGTALNRAALDLARDAGWKHVWLSVEPSNRAAIRSYTSSGFRALPGSAWAGEIEMIADLVPVPAPSADGGSGVA